MPSFRAGPAPWSRTYSEEEAFSRLATGRRVTKSVKSQYGMEYSLGRGWYRTSEDKWGPKLEKAPEKEVTLPNGRKVKVYVNPYGPAFGFSAMHDDAVAELVAETFDGHHKTYKTEGCGHIQTLEYSAFRQMLLVTFTNNGSVVAYFACPNVLAGELFRHARTKQTDSRGKHLLGIRFWDEVRIRGQLHGGKLPYQYVSHGGPVESEDEWSARIGSPETGYSYLGNIKKYTERAAAAGESLSQADKEELGERTPQGKFIEPPKKSLTQRMLDEPLRELDSEGRQVNRKAYLNMLRTSNAMYRKDFYDKLDPVRRKWVDELESLGQTEKLNELWQSWDILRTYKVEGASSGTLSEADRLAYGNKVDEEYERRARNLKF